MIIGRAAIWLSAVVLCLPATGLAQTAGDHPPVAPNGKVKPGDRIFVTDRNGVQTGGRFLRFSPQELALLDDAKERVISPSAIGRIEKPDSLWNGILLGAVPAALIGAAGAGASCSPHCGRDVPLGMLVMGAIGAGVGALIDAHVRGYSIVDGPPLASANAVSAPRPVGSVDELWLRVRQGDRIAVTTQSGGQTTGRFVQVSSGSVAVLVDGVRREIPSSDVRRVTRAGNRYRAGALAGAIIFGVLGGVASTGCNGSGCGNPLFVAAFTGANGALWGAAIGAAIPKHSAVFEAVERHAIRVAPEVGRGRFGVALSTVLSSKAR